MYKDSQKSGNLAIKLNSNNAEIATVCWASARKMSVEIVAKTSQEAFVQKNVDFPPKAMTKRNDPNHSRSFVYIYNVDCGLNIKPKSRFSCPFSLADLYGFLHLYL